MENIAIDNLIDNIDRKCDIILEQLRLEYINPLEAIEWLQDFNRRISDD